MKIHDWLGKNICSSISKRSYKYVMSMTFYRHSI